MIGRTVSRHNVKSDESSRSYPLNPFFPPFSPTTPFHWFSSTQHTLSLHYCATLGVDLESSFFVVPFFKTKQPPPTVASLRLYGGCQRLPLGRAKGKRMLPGYKHTRAHTLQHRLYIFTLQRRLESVQHSDNSSPSPHGAHSCDPFLFLREPLQPRQTRFTLPGSDGLSYLNNNDFFFGFHLQKLTHWRALVVGVGCLRARARSNAQIAFFNALFDLCG